MTIAQSFKEFTEALEHIYPQGESREIAHWIFERVTGWEKWQIREFRDNLLSDFQILELEKFLKALQSHQPVQYVLQEAWFFKMKWFVNEQVLIPRPETEELVEWGVDAAKDSIGKTNTQTPQRILDIGTGSGCIAVSLKKSLPSARVTALDFSQGALDVAGLNAREQGVEVELRKMDFLEERNWEMLGTFDFVLSNPPYIPLSQRPEMARHVVEYEPGEALFVPDENPLVFYEKIARFSQVHLTEKGMVLVEIHEDFSQGVELLFAEAGFQVTVKKDIYGKARMIGARLKVI